MGTPDQTAEILRLAALERGDGRWLLSYPQIASRLGISVRTVEGAIRQAAVQAGAVRRLNRRA